MIGPLVNDGALRAGARAGRGRRARKGAEVVTGGEADGTLLSRRPCSRASRRRCGSTSEESFGPVVAIVPVDGADEAVRVANDTEYGLAAAVFGEDVPTALDVARRIESGICHVNGSTVHDEPQMPFGGVKASGWGRFGGKAALEEFTELRWITVQQRLAPLPDVGQALALSRGGALAPPPSSSGDGGPTRAFYLRRPTRRMVRPTSPAPANATLFSYFMNKGALDAVGATVGRRAGG